MPVVGARHCVVKPLPAHLGDAVLPRSLAAISPLGTHMFSKSFDQRACHFDHVNVQVSVWGTAFGDHFHNRKDRLGKERDVEEAARFPRSKDGNAVLV